jgi:osmotically-inducible protein OsmY
VIDRARTKFPLTLVLALMGVTACHKDRAKPHAEATPSSAPSARPQPVPSDDSITAAVNRALTLDPGVSESGIQAATTDGIVELTGTAPNLLTKKRAARIVEAIRGVRAVSDRTTVAVYSRRDSEILRDVKAALLTNAAADSYEIDERVEDGRVTLNGTVQSFQEQQMAGRLAEGVLGVRDVNNLVQVKHGVRRTDSEVAADVLSRLRWDALVNDGSIDVAVHDGYVALTGKVASPAEKRRAVVDAWVLGTANVDDSALKVVVDGKERDYFRRKVFLRSDADVAKAVETAAAYDPRVSAARLRVSVDHGRATLQGSVNSVAAMFAAEDLARHTIGVTSVRNELSVEVSPRRSDADVERAVRGALLRDPYTYSQPITVHAKAGKVTL